MQPGTCCSQSCATSSRKHCFMSSRRNTPLPHPRPGRISPTRCRRSHRAVAKNNVLLANEMENPGRSRRRVSCSSFRPASDRGPGQEPESTIWTPDQVRGDGLIVANRTNILAMSIATGSIRRQLLAQGRASTVPAAPPSRCSSRVSTWRQHRRPENKRLRPYLSWRT
jgi:hypothetical protein